MSTSMPVDAAADARSRKRSRWDQKPSSTVEDGPGGDKEGSSSVTAAAAPPRKRSRWDQKPTEASSSSSSTSNSTAAPVTSTKLSESLILRGKLQPRDKGASSSSSSSSSSADSGEAWTAAALDALLPGLERLPRPAEYEPVVLEARKLRGAPRESSGGFVMLSSSASTATAAAAGDALIGRIELGGLLPPLRAEERRFFALLVEHPNEEAAAELDAATRRRRAVQRLVLCVKSGEQPLRKRFMHAFGEQVGELGADAVFGQLLPMLFSALFDEHEHHLLIKMLARAIFKLQRACLPFVGDIMAAVQPLLLDTAHIVRAEGREVIAALAGAVGLQPLLLASREDVAHADALVRDATARTLAALAASLGAGALLPYWRALCAGTSGHSGSNSNKNTSSSPSTLWQRKHTALRALQHWASLVGCGVLPHLSAAAGLCAPALSDEQSPVRTAAALALAALAEAAAPFGIEGFDAALPALWQGARRHRGKALAAFFSALGALVPLMDAEAAAHYVGELAPLLEREFVAPEDELRRAVLRVSARCVAHQPPPAARTAWAALAAAFWTPRAAGDRRTALALLEATEAFARAAGGRAVLTSMAPLLKQQQQPSSSEGAGGSDGGGSDAALRLLAADAVARVLLEGGAAALGDLGSSEEERLFDGLLFCYQEQGEGGDRLAQALRAIDALLAALGARAAPYLEPMAGMVRWRLNHRDAWVRRQAAALVPPLARAAGVCRAFAPARALGAVLAESLGEEYPDVLAGVLRALAAVAQALPLESLEPPAQELLPRLTPILQNRHDSVQQANIELVGTLAEHGARFVAAREWMRISFEMLQLLKAPKLSIRRAAVATFGHIANAIGPADVLYTLLANLKVQERTIRVCTTVAIAIVAERCGPFTTLPVLYNEFLVPELNVRTGCLKALSFVVEYIGDAAADYVYSMVPLLRDALVERDAVHRQLAANTIKHLALSVAGMGREDAILDLFNFVFPNVFAHQPHLATAVFEAVEACRVCLGPAVILQYIWQGLFHPATAVRKIYWRLYNTLYISSQDALVPAYPRIPDLIGDDSKEISKNFQASTSSYDRDLLFLFF